MLEMDKEPVIGIDSEIALTALLAASVSAFPLPTMELYPVIKLVAIGLLFITLTRRMAVIQGISPKSRLLRVTTHILDPATYISILYLIYVLIRGLSNWVGIGEVDPAVFGALGGGVIFLGFLAWELTYRAGLREGERSFDAVADRHKGEFLGAMLANLAKFVQSERVYGEQITTQKSLGSFRDNTRDIEDLTPGERIILTKYLFKTAIAIILPVISYILLMIFSGILFSGSWVARFLLLFAVIVTSGFTRLWYSRYGLLKIEERNGYITFTGTAITYLIVSWMALT